MKIKLPIKALSVNKAWAGRRFKSSYYVDFTRDVCRLLPFAKYTITSECEVHYKFYVKNYKMSDTDNMVKPITDLIVQLNYLKDDRQIVYITARKIKSLEHKIEIEIIELE